MSDLTDEELLATDELSADDAAEAAPPASPYAVLGLEQQASAEEVRRAYFRLVRQYPPETHAAEFKRIHTAYETLRSPMRRAALAVESFDESVREIDLDLLEALADSPAAADLDVAAVLLAVELSVSDLSRAAFPEDLTPIDPTSLGLLAYDSDPLPHANKVESEPRTEA